MKTILVAMSLLVSVGASAAQKETVRFTCKPWQNRAGEILVGVSSPTIVSKTSKDLWVKTSVVHPHAKPSYEKLRKLSQHIEGSQWDSASYDVNIFYARGARATIVRKGSDIFARCTAPIAPNH
jgi:hypothetical protein